MKTQKRVDTHTHFYIYLYNLLYYQFINRLIRTFPRIVKQIRHPILNNSIGDDQTRKSNQVVSTEVSKTTCSSTVYEKYYFIFLARIVRSINHPICLFLSQNRQVNKSFSVCFLATYSASKYQLHKISNLQKFHPGWQMHDTTFLNRRTSLSYQKDFNWFW